jgi:hypothetical protein
MNRPELVDSVELLPQDALYQIRTSPTPFARASTLLRQHPPHPGVSSATTLPLPETCLPDFIYAAIPLTLARLFPYRRFGLTDQEIVDNSIDAMETKATLLTRSSHRNSATPIVKVLARCGQAEVTNSLVDYYGLEKPDDLVHVRTYLDARGHYFGYYGAEATNGDTEALLSIWLNLSPAAQQPPINWPLTRIFRGIHSHWLFNQTQPLNSRLSAPIVEPPTSDPKKRAILELALDCLPPEEQTVLTELYLSGDYGSQRQEVAQMLNEKTRKTYGTMVRALYRLSRPPWRENLEPLLS